MRIFTRTTPGEEVASWKRAERCMIEAILAMKHIDQTFISSQNDPVIR